MKLTRAAFVALGFLIASSAFATGISIPHCLDDHNNELRVDNQSVLLWKRTTPNQTLKRSHLAGPIVRRYPDINKHIHFSVKIGPAPQDTIEVVYNIDFGPIKNIAVGMMVEACGDYITSNAPTPLHPKPSPDRAIIHWVHKTMNPAKHKGGFLVVNKGLYGMGAGISN